MEAKNTPANKAGKKIAPKPSTDISQKDEAYTKRFVLIMIGASVLIVIVGGILLYWLVGRYIDQSNKNKAQDMTIKLLEQKKSDLAALQPNYEKITAPGGDGKSDADRILAAMPADEGYKQLIPAIEEMGQQAGVRVSSISKSTAAGSTPAVASTYPGYAVSVPLEGNFSNVLDFVRKTEDSSRVMNFVSMSIEGSTRSGPVLASLVFSVYYKLPASIAPTTKELK